MENSARTFKLNTEWVGKLEGNNDRRVIEEYLIESFRRVKECVLGGHPRLGCEGRVRGHPKIRVEKRLFAMRV